MDPVVEALHVDDPRRLGRYELIGRLGVGGMGRVYLGRTPEGERAAVKVIKQELAADADFRQRFRREVRAAIAVAGLFTARVLDADPDGDPAWLATQFVEGPSLGDVVDRRGPMPDDAVFRLALGLTEALSGIHAAGLVHRDLKPSNILLAADGPRVIDFGIACAVEGTALTRSGHIIGTVDFMSPEQIAADRPLGPASDVFSLGTVLTYAASGRTPFAAEPYAAVLYRIVNGDPDLGGLSAPVAALVSACLRRDPRARPTAAALAAWLRATDGAVPAVPVASSPGASGPFGVHSAASGPRAEPTVHHPSGPDRPRPDTPTPPPGRRRRAWSLGAAAVGALLVAGAVTAHAGGLVRFDATGGTPTTSSAAPAPTSSAPSPSAPPDIDPNSAPARYVNRLCASGKVLSTLGDTATVPQATDDPVKARSDYLETTSRSIAVIDTALADLVPLRDEAPTPEVRTAFRQVVDEFTAARRSFSEGHDTVENSNPLTVPAYRTGVSKVADGARNLAFAATLLKQVELPKEYTDAGAVAPQCAAK